MRRYVVRRLLLLIPVLLGVSVIIFMVLHLAPGDPAEIMLGSQATQADLERLRADLGLTQPRSNAALRPPRAAGIDGDAGAKLNQVGEIATVHGQVGNDRTLQGSAQFGVGGLHHGQRFGDDDLLGLLAGL